MKPHHTPFLFAAVLPTLLVGALLGPVMASEDKAPLGTEAQREYAYGWQLMTEQERAEHQMKMRSLKTNEEREAYRLEHHQQMQERAHQQGLTLPDQPLPRGGGRGFGMGQGRGPGQ